MRLDDRVTALDGVGPKLASRLEDGLGIRTIRDLVAHYPRKFHDAGEVLDLSQVVEGQAATLLGEVLGWETKWLPKKGRKRPLEVAEGRVRQASGAVFTVTFFNQNWRAQRLPAGTVAAFSGTVKRFRSTLKLTTPDVQELGRVAAGVDPDAAAERLVACPPGDVIALEPIRSPPSARTESVQTRAPALHLAGPDADIALPPTIDEFAGDQEEASLEYRFAEIRRRAEEFLSR